MASKLILLGIFFIRELYQIETASLKKRVDNSSASDRLALVLPEGRSLLCSNDLQPPYPPTLTMKLRTLDERRLNIQLSQHHNLLSHNYTEIYYKGGKRQLMTSGSLEHECVYQGSVFEDDGPTVAIGTAAASLCHQNFEILVWLLNDTFVVTWSGRNVSLRHSHSPESFVYANYSGSNPNRCGLRGKETSEKISDTSRLKRSAVNAPKYYGRYVESTTFYVELALVFDFAVFRNYQKNLSAVFNRAKAIANVISTLYRPLNINVALVGVEVWSEGDKMTITSDPDVTLTNFLYYRKHRLNRILPTQDNAQLITGINFGEGVVGKALKGTMCSSQFSGGVNMDHSASHVAVGTTIAHEMGHNFGMEHDTDTCECPQPRCIMSPSIGSFAPPQFWSSCSLEYLQYGLRHGSAYCLINSPSAPLPYGSCGDGFLQEGEECDCGLPESCENRCCDAKTCQLAIDAKCAMGQCCDLSTCEVRKATVPCRYAAGDCDLPEFCDGKSEFCPDDVYVQNGVMCNAGVAHCYDGDCRSHDDQCRLLWGDSSTSRMSPRICFKLNEKGDIHGNCGRRKDDDSYVACLPGDSLCGQLQCVHQNEKTEFGDKSVVITGHVFIPVGVHDHAVCRHAIVDLGGNQRSNPGLVPNGAICGENRMCLNQKCVEAEKILLETPCPDDCSGNGICNSRGHCHCHPGFGGDRCAESGTGGSIDSGPPSFTSSHFNVGVGVLIFLLLVLPLITLVITVLYKKRQHLGRLGECWFCVQIDEAPHYHSETLKKSIVTIKSNAIPQSSVLKGRIPTICTAERLVNQQNSSVVVTAVIESGGAHPTPSSWSAKSSVHSRDMNGIGLLMGTASGHHGKFKAHNVERVTDSSTAQQEAPSLLSSIFEALSEEHVTDHNLEVNRTGSSVVGEQLGEKDKRSEVHVPRRPERPPTINLELAKMEVAKRNEKDSRKITSSFDSRGGRSPACTARKLLNRSLSNASGCSKESVRRPACPPPPVPPKRPAIVPTKLLAFVSPAGRFADVDQEDDGSFDESPCVSPVAEHKHNLTTGCDSYYDVVSPPTHLASTVIKEESLYTDIEEFRLSPKSNPSCILLEDKRGIRPPTNLVKPIGTATIFNGSRPPPLPRKPPSSRVT